MESINIPVCFVKPNSDYITVPVMRKFCKNEGLPTNTAREDLLSSILEYSKSNLIKVKTWIDTVLKEGIKHIYLTRFITRPQLFDIVKDDNKLDVLISEKFGQMIKINIVDCKVKEKLALINYSCSNDKSIVSLIFCISLLIKNNSSEIGNYILYPVFVDIDLNNQYIIGRGKSIMNIYEYSADKIVRTDVRTEKLIIDAINLTVDNFGLQIEDKDPSKARFKNKLFSILDKFTVPPDSIKAKIENCQQEIKDFINTIFTKNGIENRFYDKALMDLNIFSEKFISINEPDKTIFTQNSKAFPIKIGVTSQDMVKVEESSINKEPLQHTEAFYDNKKSTELMKMCDILTLCFKRLDSTYFGGDPFVVKLIIKNKRFCHLAFMEFVEEEDIQNVLSYIVED